MALAGKIFSHQMEYRVPELLAQSLLKHSDAIAPICLKAGLASPDASNELLHGKIALPVFDYRTGSLI